MTEYWVAAYNYTATTAENLSLQAGETVIVHEKGSSGWWNGQTGIASGWFPESYVVRPTEEPLALGWAPLQDDRGQTYYVHTGTNETSWHRPGINASLQQQQQQQEAAVPRSTSSSRLAAVASSPTVAEPEPEPAEDPDRIVSKTTQRDGKVYAVNAQDKVTYSDNFWGDTASGSGFDVLVLKHRNAKEVFKDIAEWMRDRSAVEERYAKELLRLSKSTLGDIEEGTSKTAWAQVKFDMNNQATIHAKISARMIDQVEKQLMDFKDQAKKKRKDFENIIAKDRKNIQAREQEVDKARRSYVEKMRAADAAELVLSRAANDPNKSATAKLDATAKAERKKATQAGIDYKKALQEYNEARDQWRDDMSLAMLDFQEAETERVEYLKTVLQGYIDCDREARDALASSAEMALNSVQAVAPEIDIEMFVKAKATGTRPPARLRFRAYDAKVDK